MRAEGRAGGDAPHAPGGLRRSAIAAGSAGTSSADGPATDGDGYRLVVEGTALAKLEEDNGWTVLATPVATEAGAAAEILQAYQAQTTTVEPGFRGSKQPAAIAPGWLEKPERIAA